MSKENNFEAALTKHCCLICTKEMNGDLIINTRLTSKAAKEVKNLHGKVVAFADEPCDECKKNLDTAFIFIGYDEKKSDLNNLPEGFYRTGKIIGVKKEIPLIEEFVKENNPLAYKKGFTFFPNELMIKFGLIEDNIENES